MQFEPLSRRTERLLLRPLQPSDAPAIFAIRSDATVMRFASSLPLVTLDEAEAFVAREVAARAEGHTLRLALERVQALIGSCILFNSHAQCRRAEIGYELHRDAWGRGYMHEALRAMLDIAFVQFGLNRIEADIDPRNTASARSLERVGFTREGLLRERWIVNDEVSDSALYGLLRSDWQSGV